MSRKRKQAMRIVGAIFCLVGIIVSWVLEAELLQDLQEPESPAYFNKPYFLTWVLSIGYGAFLFGYIPARLFEHLRSKPKTKRSISNPSLMSSPTASAKSDSTNKREYYFKRDMLIIKASSILVIPYFLCGWFWLYSLPHTSVSTNTVIYNSSFVMIFLMSVVLLGESISVLKVITVVLSFAGTIIITYSGTEEEENGVDITIWGYLAVFLSTVFYAVYQVLFKYWTDPEAESAPSLSLSPSDSASTTIETFRFLDPLASGGNSNAIGRINSLSGVKNDGPMLYVDPQNKYYYRLKSLSNPVLLEEGNYRQNQQNQQQQDQQQPQKPLQLRQVVQLLALDSTTQFDSHLQDSFSMNSATIPTTPKVHDMKTVSSPVLPFVSNSNTGNDNKDTSPMIAVDAPALLTDMIHDPSSSSTETLDDVDEYSSMLSKDDESFKNPLDEEHSSSSSFEDEEEDSDDDDDDEEGTGGKGGNEDRSMVEAMLFLGWIGAMTGLVLWPGIFVLNWTGVETFEWPSREAWPLIVLNSVLDNLVNILTLVGIRWTSPVLISMGALLMIPASVVMDMLVHQYLMPWSGFLGMFAIIVGFFLLNLSEFLIDRKKKRAREAERNSKRRRNGKKKKEWVDWEGGMKKKRNCCVCMGSYLLEFFSAYWEWKGCSAKNEAKSGK